MALAKGGLVADHVLICPIAHFESTVKLTEVGKTFWLLFPNHGLDIATHERLLKFQVLWAKRNYSTKKVVWPFLISNVFDNVAFEKKIEQSDIKFPWGLVPKVTPPKKLRYLAEKAVANRESQISSTRTTYSWLSIHGTPKQQPNYIPQTTTLTLLTPCPPFQDTLSYTNTGSKF